MKISDALKVMQSVPRTTCEKGYMVHFERVQGCMLAGDHFPDKHAGETLIESEELAWDLAAKFASATVGNCVNVYVIGADFVPVPGYQLRKIENRKPAGRESVMADMKKKRVRINDRQCRLFLRDIKEFGYTACTFDEVREIANQVAEGTASDRDPVAIIMATQIDEAEEAVRERKGGSER